jgi:hypothetical protein
MSKSKEPPGELKAKAAARELDPHIEDFVARSLQAHYASFVQAPVPDRFLALLAQLEVEEKKAAEEKINEQR